MTYPVSGQYQSIINFNDTITISGKTFRCLSGSGTPGNPITPYNMVAYGGPIYRTCVNNGQNDAFQGDTPNYIRSEVYGPFFPFNTSYVSNFDFYVGPQSPTPITTLDWFIPFQIHVGTISGTGKSPPISLDILPDGSGGEILRFDHNYDSGSGVNYASFGQVSFTRNVWHTCSVTFVDSQGASTGSCTVVYDGVTVVNVSGVPTGYFDATGPSYPKFGIYAGVVTGVPPDGTNLQVFHRNLSFPS